MIAFGVGGIGAERAELSGKGQAISITGATQHHVREFVDVSGEKAAICNLSIQADIHAIRLGWKSKIEVLSSQSNSQWICARQ